MSEDTTPTHRLKGELTRNGTAYDAGTRLVPTEHELRAFPDRFEELESDAQDVVTAEPEVVDDGDDEADDDGDEHPSAEEFTETPVAEYRRYVRNHDLSADKLQAMLDAERDRPDDETRSTVVSLLESALEDTADDS